VVVRHPRLPLSPKSLHARFILEDETLCGGRRTPGGISSSRRPPGSPLHPDGTSPAPTARLARRSASSCLLYVCSAEVDGGGAQIAVPITILFLDVCVAKRRAGQALDTVITTHNSEKLQVADSSSINSRLSGSRLDRALTATNLTREAVE
jgi:hypothetical protein